MNLPLYTPPFAPQRELGVLRDLTTLPKVWRDIRAGHLPKGRGKILVIPGFLTGDATTWFLRAALTSLGYEVYGWGLGINRGDVWALTPHVEAMVKRHAHDGPIHLIGWSLGGVLAREVARRCPQEVKQVITMGTPVVDGPFYTSAARFYMHRVRDLEELKQRIRERESVPIHVPVTAFYSLKDAIVCPAACIDPINTHIQHIPIACTHAGFGVHAEVLRRIAPLLTDEIASSTTAHAPYSTHKDHPS